MRPLIHKSTEPPPAAPAPTKKRTSPESVKTLKLVLAIVGLLVGGALIAWNFGIIGDPGPPPAPPYSPVQPGSAAPASPPLSDPVQP